MHKLIIEHEGLITRIFIEVLWTNPELGFYVPIVKVSGDMPDNLDTTKVMKYFIQATHNALHDPTLSME